MLQDFRGESQEEKTVRLDEQLKNLYSRREDCLKQFNDFRGELNTFREGTQTMGVTVEQNQKLIGTIAGKLDEISGKQDVLAGQKINLLKTKTLFWRDIVVKGAVPIIITVLTLFGGAYLGATKAGEAVGEKISKDVSATASAAVEEAFSEAAR